MNVSDTRTPPENGYEYFGYQNMMGYGGNINMPNSNEWDKSYDQLGQFGCIPQPNTNPPYHFVRRINKMNWEMMGNIDVGTIAKNNDVASIDFLMRSIAFANITPDDIEQFGSRASLNSFLLLQLSVEYLLFRLNTIPIPPKGYQKPQENKESHLISHFESRIDLLNKDIKSRDMIIESLTEKLHKAENERDLAVSKLRNLKKRVISKKTDAKKDINESVKKPHVDISSEEPGSIHVDTEYLEYLRDHPLRSTRKSKEENPIPTKRKKRDEHQKIITDISSLSQCWDYSMSSNH